MNPAATTFSVQKSSPLLAILWGGGACGTLDITAAIVVYCLIMGAKPLHLLQGIAGGLLGPRTFSGGLATASSAFSVTSSSLSWPPLSL